MKTVLKNSALLLAVLCLMLSLAACTGNHPYEEKYLLYIGYVDKSEDELDALKAEINELCRTHLSGYTMWECEGGWTNDQGQFIAEDTLVYAFNFAEKDDVVALANEIIEQIPDTNILFETQYTSAIHSSSDDFPKK